MRGPNSRYHTANIIGGSIAVPLAAVAFMFAAKTETDTCIDRPAAAATLEAKNSKQALGLRLDAFASMGACQMLRAATTKDRQGIGSAFDEAPTTDPRATRTFSWRYDSGSETTSLPPEASYYIDVIGENSSGIYPIDPKAVKAFSIGYKSPADDAHFYGIAFSRSGVEGNQWTVAYSGSTGTRAYSTDPDDKPRLPDGIPPEIGLEQLDEELFHRLAGNVQRMVRTFEAGVQHEGALPIFYGE